jgi:transglutaminase-like putative cysteine protease
MLMYAVPMAVLLELKNHIDRRWVFTQSEFYLLADVTALVFMGLVVYYFSTTRATHILFFLLQIMPMVFYPLVLALNYSTTEKLTLDVFVYSFRNDRISKPGLLELDHIYLGVCLVAMSTQVESRLWFPLLLAVFMVWVMYVNRSERYRPVIWSSLMLLAFAVSLVGSVTLRDSHQLLKEKSADWLAGLIRSRTDPFKTQTAIGRVGALKLSDQILFRVEADDRPGRSMLLHEASYDTPSSNGWLALNPGFKSVPQPSPDSWRWHKQSPLERTLVFYSNHDDDKGLLPVPQSGVAVSGFKAVELARSNYGAVRAIGITPQPYYQVHYLDGGDLYGPPGTSDTSLTEERESIFRRVIDADALALLNPAQRVQHVKQFFDDFRYTLFQPDKEIANSPMEHFLQVTRAGHCEYFASATAMMLRAVGIPARYVVGYSLQEFSPTLNMYVVRSRHAHAWAIAHYGGRWHVVDTTPSTWLETESGQSALYRPMLDMIANLVFLSRHWWNSQTEYAKNLGLLLLALGLSLFLTWRMMGSPQVRIGNNESKNRTSTSYPGAESPFYKIESLLEEKGMWRYRGEPLGRWIKRIKHHELMALLPVHYRWRFDPFGPSVAEKEQLVSAVDDWIRKESQSTPD